MDRHLRLLSLSIPSGRSSPSHQGMRAGNIPPLLSKLRGGKWRVEIQKRSKIIPIRGKVQITSEGFKSTKYEKIVEIWKTPLTCSTSLWTGLLPVWFPPACGLLQRRSSAGSRIECIPLGFIYIPRRARSPSFFLSLLQNRIKVWPELPCWKLTNGTASWQQGRGYETSLT